MSTRRNRALLLLAAAALVSPACAGSPTSPPPPTPPSTPSISCPASYSLTSPTGQATAVTYNQPTTNGGTAPLQVTCTPTSGSILPVGPTTINCTATDAKQLTASCTFVITVTAPPRISVTRFLAFGDSMTAGEITNPTATGIGKQVVVPDKSYPADLANALIARYTAQAASIAVDNAGVPGEELNATATRTRFNQRLSAAPYNLALLMDGANDIATKDSKVIQPTVAAMAQLVRDARSRGLRVIVATLPPQDGSRPNGAGAVLVAQYNDALRSMAATEGIALADVFQAFGGDTTTLIGSDGLHPTVAGYQRIAETFFTIIRGAFEVPGSSATAPAAIQPPVLTPFARRSYVG